MSDLVDAVVDKTSSLNIEDGTVQQDAPRPRKKFTGKKFKKVSTEKVESGDALTTKKVFKAKLGTQIPDDILNNNELNQAISLLPSNYNFEIYKTLWRIRQVESKRVGLQMPEGLLVYACTISDILERFGGVETVIMGDVTYGACCIDDFTADSLGCDLLVHYGHSCLIPIDTCKMNVLYVFVDIKFDLDHFVETMKANFSESRDMRIGLIATIQFTSSLHIARCMLLPYFPNLYIPQAKPLSQGEILGCTSPKMNNQDILVYLGDGRFHLESIMISNPDIVAYRYDPYSKVFSLEGYDITKMHNIRSEAIDIARRAKKYGIILGTLGRQGSVNILNHLEELLNSNKIPYVIILLSEIIPSKLDMFGDIDAWVQIACPRLSIDWGYAFSKPLLNTYEAEVALNGIQWQEIYPMDYYSKDGGKWSNYYKQ